MDESLEPARLAISNSVDNERGVGHCLHRYNSDGLMAKGQDTVVDAFKGAPNDARYSYLGYPCCVLRVAWIVQEVLVFRQTGHQRIQRLFHVREDDVWGDVMSSPDWKYHQHLASR